MDLPTCPACGQSVLDEDAQDCPFCGSPMKGGAPAGRTAAKAPVKPAAAKVAPAKGPSASAAEPGKPLPAVNKPAAKSKSKPGDDDPFAVDDPAAASAIAVSPRPGGGKTLEVVCPMCETKGYVSPKAAGKAVKCHNSECMVPVFTAPVIEKEVLPAAPPPKSKPSAGLLIGVGAAVLVVAGGVGFMMFGGGSAPAPDLNKPIPLPKPLTKNESPVTDPLNPATAGPTEDPKKPPNGTATAAVSKSRDELNKQILKELVEASYKAKPGRKPFCRRLAALAHVASGDIAGAQERLDQLLSDGDAFAHELIFPLVAIAWRQLAANQEGEFKKTVEAASVRAKQLPERGRASVEAATALAAVLAAADRMDEARSLTATHRRGSSMDQLAAALEIVQADGSFDLDRTLPGRSLGGWQFPLEVAVTLSLIAHGRWDDAQAWAAKAAIPADRVECTTVWAEALAGRALAENLPQDLERAAAAADALPAAGKARLLARLADLQLGKRNRAAAEALMQGATAALASITAPAPVRIGGMKELLELKLPDDPSPLHMAALAAAEVAGVQARLGQPELAWKNLQTGLAHLRGTAPSVSYVRKQLDDIKTSGTEATRVQLKATLELKDDDEARRRFVEYKEKCTRLLTTAGERFQWEFELLAAAVQAGLLDQVWGELQALQGKPDPNDQEAFLDTVLPALLAARYEAAGKTEQRDAIRAVMQSHPNVADRKPLIQQETLRLIDTGNVAEAVKQLTAEKPGALDEWTLRLACRLTKAEKYDAALQLLAGVGVGVNVLLREEGQRLIAALAASRGQAEKFRNVSAVKIPAKADTAPEVVAVCTGLVEGLARMPTETKSTPAATKAEDGKKAK